MRKTWVWWTDICDLSFRHGVTGGFDRWLGWALLTALNQGITDTEYRMTRTCWGWTGTSAPLSWLSVMSKGLWWEWVPLEYWEEAEMNKDKSWGDPSVNGFPRSLSLCLISHTHVHTYSQAMPGVSRPPHDHLTRCVVNHPVPFCFKKKFLIRRYVLLIFSERGRDRERKRETLMWEASISCLPYVPPLGSKPAT